MRLGIDQSFSSTGIVLYHMGQVVDFSLIKTEPNKLDHLDVFKRCITISDKILGIVDMMSVTELYIEGLGFGSVGDATRNLAMLQAMIISKIITKHPHISINIVPPTTLKKFATDSGKASKVEMYNALPEEVKVLFKDVKKTKGLYDLTDAYFLSTYHKKVQ